ncbi:MAG TPA: cyclic lactone autoinducer peptide [Candidatus Paceibacterota bacterium]
MKTLNMKFYAVIAAVATIVAATVATSACFFWLYQPEEPKSLRDE